MRLLSWLSLAVLGCGSAPPAPPPSAPPPSAPSQVARSGIERLFPLQDQHIYSYVTENDAGQGRLVARVSHSGPTGGDLSMAGTTKSFEYASDGIRQLRADGPPVYVLKPPLAVGTRWRGEYGGNVEIIKVDASIDVPAGRYSGCVQTLETRGGDKPLRVATTFCPDVGIVLLEAQSGGALESASLEYYGPPVQIGPDGVTISK